jgi:hypothetical protein
VAAAGAFFALAACSNPLAVSEQPDCFELHVRDALDVYEVRKPLYESISDGRSSLPIFVLTILQRLNLPGARAFDKRARDLRRRGVEGLGCREFVSMDEVPAFRQRIPPNANERFQKPDLPTLGKTLQQLLKTRDYAGLTRASQGALAELASSPHHHCLLRHFLESIARAADLAPQHLKTIQSFAPTEERSEILQNETLAWVDDFIGIHLKVLRAAHFLDQRATPLQRDGIALFCQDLPAIPLYGTSASH